MDARTGQTLKELVAAGVWEFASRTAPGRVREEGAFVGKSAAMVFVGVLLLLFCHGEIQREA